MFEFDVTRSDRAVIGIKHRDGRLVIRPTGPALVAGALYAVAGTVIIAASFLAAVTFPASLGLGLIGALAICTGLRCLLARVTADALGIAVVNHWRTASWSWGEIQSISARPARSRWGRLPYSSPWNPPHAFEVGVVSLDGGREMVCDALVSVASSRAFDNERSPTDVKVEAIRAMQRDQQGG
jgi:hypothetical protein